MRIVLIGQAAFGREILQALLKRGEQVVVYDNLSRRGTEANVAWLREQHGAESFQLVVGDVREAEALARETRGMDVVVHLAGQTAVTTSVADPRADFEHNALGTFNALEAARHAGTHRHPERSRRARHPERSRRVCVTLSEVEGSASP